jgi:hypothetical protein
LKKDQDEKYVKIFRALVNCNEKAIISNQGEISNRLLKDKKVRRKLLYEVIPYDNFKKIIVKNAKFPKGKNLKDFKDEGENKKAMRYFSEMILLCSDLCLDRNFIAIDVLKREYPFPVCFAILNDKINDMAIRYSFIKLVITLWIDIDISPLISPKTIWIWNDIPVEQDLLKSSSYSERNDSIFIKDS